MGKLMIYGTTSSAGKSLITTGLCRIYNNKGYKVTPFKSQNMSRNSYTLKNGKIISSAQVLQSMGARIEPTEKINPLLLVPNSDIGSEVFFLGESIGNMKAKDYFQYKKDLGPKIKEIFESVEKEFDIVFIEGAGSPCEINLLENDIVNTGMAEIADTNAILVVDIDRGGAFAHLYGTVMLLEEKDRKRIKGFIINKFRGDVELLKPGLDMIEELTDIPVLGVVYYGNYDLPDEDSLSDRNNSKGIGEMEMSKIDKEIDRLASDLERSLDIDKLEEIMNL